jgi:hypothetical protein
MQCNLPAMQSGITQIGKYNRNIGLVSVIMADVRSGFKLFNTCFVLRRFSQILVADFRGNWFK